MELSKLIAINRDQAEKICQRLNDDINQLGFTDSEIQHYPIYDEASFELIKDPYSGEQNLACYWYNKTNKQRIGRLQFNSDGSFYAEYDVVKAHPGKPKLFVEAVTAWGKAGQIKSEPKLLDIPQ